MVTGLIYLCEHIGHNKYYVGQTTQGLEKRKKQHIRDSESEDKSKYDLKFHKAIKEFGSENFKWSILVEISSESSDALSESLNELEWFYIKKYNSFQNGYNMTRGGDNNIIKPARIIICYDVEGEKLKEYDNIEDASSDLNIHESTIKLTLNHKLEYIKKSYNRYVFRYDGDEYTKSQIIANSKKLSEENIYVFDMFGKLIDTCLNLGKFCDKYCIKISQARKCMNKEAQYLISDNFPDYPIIISKGDIPEDIQLEYTKLFYNNPSNRSRFFITVIDKQTGESKLYPNLAKASKTLNIDYRILQRNLGEFKKKEIEIGDYKIINKKYYGPGGERLC